MGLCTKKTGEKHDAMHDLLAIEYQARKPAVQLKQ